jgi:hypothetical protein
MLFFVHGPVAWVLNPWDGAKLIAHHLAYVRPVALLYPGVIVLLIEPRPRHLDARGSFSNDGRSVLF